MASEGRFLPISILRCKLVASTCFWRSWYSGRLESEGLFSEEFRVKSEELFSEELRVKSEEFFAEQSGKAER